VRVRPDRGIEKQLRRMLDKLEMGNAEAERVLAKLEGIIKTNEIRLQKEIPINDRNVPE